MNQIKSLNRKLMIGVTLILGMAFVNVLQAQVGLDKDLDNSNRYHKTSIQTIQLKVFPNPTTDVVNISVEDLDSAKTFKISNILGKLITDGLIESKLTSIDLLDLKPGIYLISIFDGKQQKLTTKKIIKN